MTNKRIIFLLFSLLLLWGPQMQCSYAQGLALPLKNEYVYLLDRLETRSGRLCDTLCLSSQTEYYNQAAAFAQTQLKDAENTLSHYDRLDLQRFLAAQVSGDSTSLPGRNFYAVPGNLFSLRSSHFNLTINPVFSSQITTQTGDASGVLFMLSYGAQINCSIANRWSVNLNIDRVQEQLPGFLNTYTRQMHAIPGIGYYTGSGNYQYWNNTGYISYTLIKNHLDIAAGRGKNFVGDGLHSIFLSDNSAPSDFAKINTRIWKFNYENLFIALTPEYGNINQLSSKSYMAIHDLSVNLTRWLNAGVFETIVFSRPGSWEVDYLNPVVFYRYTERTNGSPDNALLGFTLKAVIAKHLQLYGQFMLDEFTQKQFFGGHGYWANKFGFQAGAKYFDAFGVKNLDLQAEANAVRPYTYAHSDTVINYTNYNQPLADPWGSGFIGVTGRLKYRIADKWDLVANGSFYTRGADTANINFGNNPLLNYTTRNRNFGVPWISGVRTNCLMVGVNLSYRLYHDLYLDLGGAMRNFTSQTPDIPLSSVSGTTTGNNMQAWYYFGIRLNATRRAYDAYF